MSISVVILNWQRPRLLKHIILPYISRHPLVSEIIISHGREASIFKYKSKKCDIIHRNDSKINEKHGLTRRYIAARAVKNETILIMDDDLIPFSTSITKLYQALEKEPKIIHGLFGRKMNQNHEYIFKKLKSGLAPILLTRCLILKKECLEHFFSYKNKVDLNVIKQGDPFWNGEDIFLSLCAIKANKQLNRAHKGFHLNLPFVNGVAISAKKTHRTYRKMITQYFTDILNIRKYL